MPANRPATERTQSLSPLFSWMTSTAPFGLCAGAHAPCSSPCGPAHVIGSEATVFSEPGGGPFSTVAPPVEVTGASAVGFLPSPHAAISAVAAVAPTPINASLRKASRLDSNPST